ncbi:MAG: AAA family ATPase, partial [Acidimicrobiales bacterium]|nr:AAA family ATPase [Acidimicrobiales bacterium]
EQDHVDRTYERIEQLREQAVARASEAAKFTDNVPGALADREAALAAAGFRRSRFVVGNQSICFGRLDTQDHEIFHIGRLGVSDVEGDPMLVDWRAPIAESFYRATPRDPRGLSRRRHIRMHARTVVGVDDEALDQDALADAEHSLVGEAALLSALAAPRSGQMGDIVATIQGQQDEAIRAPLRGILVVQGGPGTGKTAVALHRAAYLLYAHELELSVQGVLVVGPNAIFARYVENVLPGLGETGVRLATPADLVDGVTVSVVESPAVGRVKGSAAMVATMRDTLYAHVAAIDAPVAIGFERWRLEVTTDDARAVIDAVVAQDKPYAEGRVLAYRALLGALTAKAAAATDRSVRAGQLSRHYFDERAVRRRLADDPEIRALTSRIWPVVQADALVDEVLVDLGFAADRTARSVHDAALVDEARALIGEPPTRKEKTKAKPRIDSILERTLADMGLIPDCKVCGSELSPKGFDWVCTTCDSPRRWKVEQVLAPVQVQQLNETIAHVTETYGEAEEVEQRSTWGHVLVDEAQELTHMQWRMLTRRCPTRSFTIVGDLNQSGGASDVGSWEAVGCAIDRERAAHVLTLEVNYRTPEEIMEVANALLRAQGEVVNPPRSVRAAGERPVAIAADSFERALAMARTRAADEVARTEAGTVAVIVPAEVAPSIGPEALDQRVVEIGVEQVRGLEFDSVIIVEPNRYARGDLYVALTRATTRLAVVYVDPLPNAIRDSF